MLTWRAADDGEQLSLTLCDDAFIQQLNNEWRSIDAPTDVLSFPMDDDQLLGDLVISIDTARSPIVERLDEDADAGGRSNPAPHDNRPPGARAPFAPDGPDDDGDEVESMDGDTEASALVY